MTPLVEFESVSAGYGARVVFRELSWTIQSAARWAVLGPSGAGKSTLLELFAGLEAPRGGRIRINGRIASRPGRIETAPHLRGLAMVFQDLALWPNLTAFENVELGLSGLGLQRGERSRRVREALEACRIAQLGDRRPAALSGGEQQRLALARALAVRPNALLLDEPFSGLDIDLKNALFAEIRRLVSELGCALILVSHDPWETAALCSHALVLEDGKPPESGELNALLAAPVSRTMQAFAECLAAPTLERSEPPRRRG